TWNDSVSSYRPGTTGLVTTEGVGRGMVPSTPTRNTDAPGLPRPAPALQAEPGVVALHSGVRIEMVWSNPTPSIGISTAWTVLLRSKTSENPPRITVLRLPISLPRSPPLESGFQAKDARGATFPQSML